MFHFSLVTIDRKNPYFHPVTVVTNPTNASIDLILKVRHRIPSAFENCKCRNARSGCSATFAMKLLSVLPSMLKDWYNNSSFVYIVMDIETSVSDTIMRGLFWYRLSYKCITFHFEVDLEESYGNCSTEFWECIEEGQCYRFRGLSDLGSGTPIWPGGNLLFSGFVY